MTKYWKAALAFVGAVVASLIATATQIGPGIDILPVLAAALPEAISTGFGAALVTWAGPANAI